MPLGLSETTLMCLLEQGKLILIFDEWNEQEGMNDLRKRVGALRATLQLCEIGSAKVIIFCRPNLYESRSELDAALGVSMENSDTSLTTVISLQPFSLEQAIESLRAYPAHVIQQMSNLIMQSAHFYDFVAKPSTLHAMASIWPQLAETLDPETVTVTSVFHLLHLKALKTSEGASQYKWRLSAQQRSFIHSGVILHLAMHQTRIHTQAQIARLVTCLVDALPSASTQDSTRRNGTTWNAERIQIEARIVAFNGITLEVDSSRPGLVRIPNWTMFRYVLANEIARATLSPRSKRWLALSRVTGFSLDKVLPTDIEGPFLLEALLHRMKDTSTIARFRNVDIGKVDKEEQIVVARRLHAAIVPSPRSPILRQYLISLAVQLSHPATSTLALAVPLLVFFTLWILSSYLLPMNNFDVRALLVCLVLLTIAVTLVAAYSQLIFRLRLWAQICERIGFSDAILYRAIGMKQQGEQKRFPLL